MFEVGILLNERPSRSDDFIGVQTYSRSRFGPDGPLPAEDGVPVLAMGYEYWPQALEGTIRWAAEATGVPVVVTENGIGTDDDAQRVSYYREALSALVRCLDDGVDVRGYYAWSLLDNFEWIHGYGPRFGLVSVDRTTQVRTPKPSARLLGEVARKNAFDPRPRSCPRRGRTLLGRRTRLLARHGRVCVQAQYQSGTWRAMRIQAATALPAPGSPVSMLTFSTAT